MAKESKVSPWVRPALLGSVAFMTFGVALFSGAIEGFGFNGKSFGIAVMEVMQLVPEPLFDLFGLMFFVYGFGKSGEKMIKHWRGPQEAPQETFE